MPIRIAVIGVGKIARDQHLPAIAANPNFDLVATAGPGVGIGSVPNFPSHSVMLENLKGRIDAVAICTPPMVRYLIARDCLIGGLHVLLEKPPTVTLGDVNELAKLAGSRGLALFTAWHARYNVAVETAASILFGKAIKSLEIEWREDVGVWHPGQAWIWSPGGFGVFDAGINAISIATMVSPTPLLVKQAEFLVPANVQMPIAASIVFSGDTPSGGLTARLDWRAGPSPTATLQITTEDGIEITLRDGGAALYVNKKLVAAGDNMEYQRIYGRFAHLIPSRLCDVDNEPLRIVADAFLLAHRETGEPFTF